MDKFTVDLDQVLNDFEYSELTDQYSNTARILPEPRSVPHAAPAVSKHSINNVFHSLNEYLNTNIGLNESDNKEDPSENGKTDEDCDAAPGYSQLIDVSEESPDTQTSLEDCPTDFTTASDLSDKDKPVEEPSKVESDIEDDDNYGVPLKDVVTQNISLQDELLQAGHGENQKVSEVPNDAKTLIGFDDNFNLDDQEISKLLSELEEDDDLNTNQVEESLEEPERPNVEIDTDVLNDPSTIETQNLQVETAQETPLNESVEHKIATLENPTIEECLENVDQDRKFDEHEEEINAQLPNIKESIDKVISEELNSKQFPTIEPEIDEDPELTEPLLPVEETNTNESRDETNDKECNEETNSTELDLKEDPNITDLSEDMNPFNEEKCEDLPGEKVSEAQIQKDTSQDSLPRPQNLSLSKGIESNRKIDLIGEPGSTPYNNIYVNNEINQQEGNTSDLDCSSTSSQSFSDGSSTVSTASTEDIQDKSDIANLDDTKMESEHSDQNAVEAVESPGVSTRENREDPVVQESSSSSETSSWIGKKAPLWIPDSEAMSCMQCDMKFTVLKRRHHCRACGLVLCSKCCHVRFRLEYLNAEARVCNKCHDILNNKDCSSGSSSSDLSPESGNSPHHRPNPNNPAEYCSTVSPLQQASGNGSNPPPAVMVPVGVLKRKGSNKVKSNKSVMFCDGIRPGSDLTNLDNDFNYNNAVTKKLEKANVSTGKVRNLPLIDSDTNTFIPKNENMLPPLVTTNKTDIKYTECFNNLNTINILKTQKLTFAIHLSLQVHVKIIDMSCCMNKTAWCFATEGLINVGQDEIVYVLEYTEDECTAPKDIFYHITNIYNEAVKGNAIKEMGLSLHNSPNFLDSKNHAGFVYIRPTFQCLENVLKPQDPYIIGILVHRWETPWAKLFPLRLVLRLGAEYRYYPSPIISTRNRDSVYVEIGHTIINILADFRNFSYTLPQIRGLTVHMEDKKTMVNIPANRYDQVIKSLNNSSDHILAFAGNFSLQADSHLVCIQDTQGNENCYSTHAINIHNKPRKITGASFIVFNGALKSSSGLTAKSNIIEDGLMVQVLPEDLEQIRESLRSMKNHTISCGCAGEAVSDETVQIVWGENDSNFNMGIVSAIDNMQLNGIPSIRVHNGKNYVCRSGGRIIRWTEVFIIQNGEDNPKNQEPVDISRVSESIARATCDALVKYIDLLITNNFQKIGIRATLHVDDVSYCAGSNGTKFPPIYMKSLDDELIPVLHRITSNNFGENSVVLELIFRILNV